MRDSWEADRRLTADMQRLEHDRALVVAVDRLDDLTADSTCLDDLALTLTAARDLPDELTVRVAIRESSTVGDAEIADALTAMQRLAADASYVAWREATTIRSAGRRQRPVGIAASIVAAFLAYACWFVATESDTTAVRTLFWVLGGLAITVAWVFSWLVVEDNWYTWREPARRARALDLLSRAASKWSRFRQPSAAPRIILTG